MNKSICPYCGSETEKNMGQVIRLKDLENCNKKLGELYDKYRKLAEHIADHEGIDFQWIRDDYFAWLEKNKKDGKDGN